MADKYIINMPEKTTPVDTDLVMVEDAQDTKRMTWANLVKPIKNMFGNLASLATTHKSTIVGSINEVSSKLGNLNSLTTTHKNTLVGAINELKSSDNYTPAKYSLNLINGATGLDNPHLVKTGKTIFFKGLIVAGVTAASHVVTVLPEDCRVSVADNTVALNIDTGSTHRVLLATSGWVTLYNVTSGGRYKLMPYSLEG